MRSPMTGVDERACTPGTSARSAENEHRQGREPVGVNQANRSAISLWRRGLVVGESTDAWRQVPRSRIQTTVSFEFLGLAYRLLSGESTQVLYIGAPMRRT